MVGGVAATTLPEGVIRSVTAPREWSEGTLSVPFPLPSRIFLMAFLAVDPVRSPIAPDILRTKNSTIVKISSMPHRTAPPMKIYR